MFGYSLRLVVLLLGVALGLVFKLAAGMSPGASAQGLGQEPPSYVGSGACAGCHAQQFADWTTSDHAHAMSPATAETVLGDFAGPRIEHLGATAQFRRDEGKFIVETEGRDGKIAPFVVSHTFGWKPLQQYLVTFPDGRLQTLPWAWDTRPRDQGGQRWFHVYGDQPIPPGDVLHWTGRFQNWNYMCAECHSTAVSKNYLPAADRFDTRFSEISVGCEGCHGPAGGHMAWAAGSPRTGDASRGFANSAARRVTPNWTPDPRTGSPAHGVDRPEGDEVETCARCHSRRGINSEAWKPGRPLADTHMPSMLTQGLFEADGQMLDEVFNDHSFKQSLMYAKGVVCSDCHEPHSGKLKAEGAEVCSQCHQPERFAAKTHTGHETGSGAPDCISCHMPARTYMVVDKRHDHSFRIPRPDLTVTLSTPNTCNACHTDRSASWAADAVTRWHGPERKGFQTYAQAFHDARAGDPAARAQLIALARDGHVPAVARATALDELAAFPSVATEQAIRAGLRDADPLVRIAALRAAAARPIAERMRWAGDLLEDPIDGVRTEAARSLADARDADVAPERRVKLARPFAEYEATQRLNADRPEGRANLASFFMRHGRTDDAETELLAGLKLDPAASGLSINLADLYRQTGREAAGEQALLAALSISPQDASLRHALGLTLVRQKRIPQAMDQLARAVALDPANARFGYVYGVALQSTGRGGEALAVWTKVLETHPWDASTLSALMSDALARRDRAQASKLANRLSALQPDDAELARQAARLARP